MIEKLDIYLYVWMEVNRSKLKNCQVYFFDSDGETLIPIYADKNGIAPLCNPAWTDFEGNLDVYVSKPYVCRIFDGKELIHDKLYE